MFVLDFGRNNLLLYILINENRHEAYLLKIEKGEKFMDKFWVFLKDFIVPLYVPLSIIGAAWIGNKNYKSYEKKKYKGHRYKLIQSLHDSIISFTMNTGGYGSIVQTDEMYEQEIFDKLLIQYNTEFIIPYYKILSWFPEEHKKILKDYNKYSRSFFTHFGMAVENMININNEIQRCKKTAGSNLSMYHDLIENNTKIHKNKKEKREIIYGTKPTTSPSKENTLAGIADEIIKLAEVLFPILDELSKKY